MQQNGMEGVISMYHIILASESPRRSEIMKTMGISFEVIASNAKEIITEKEPGKIVEELAALKATNIAKKLEDMQNSRDNIIIGADTMVFYNGQALGKPKDKEDAYLMLQMLSGHEHEVYTGVCIIIRKEGKSKKILFPVCTKVFVQNLSREEIEAYIETGEPMDKAGAYGIQGKFGIHISSITGDYYNVMGLPIAQIYQTLLENGIDIKKLK